MKQWQRAPLSQRQHAMSWMKAMQETPARLMSMNVKIVRSACGAATSSQSARCVSVCDISRATRRAPSKSRARTLSREFWQRKNFCKKCVTMMRTRESGEVFRESHAVIREALIVVRERGVRHCGLVHVGSDADLALSKAIRRCRSKERKTGLLRRRRPSAASSDGSSQ